MSLVNMKGILSDAQKNKYAVGAFNIVNFQTAQAAIKAAEAVKSPIILQTSVGTVKQIGVTECISFLRNLAENATVPVAIHLDHCTSPEFVLQCIDCGWTSVMIDLSKKPYEENREITHNIAVYAHTKNVSVEGELGAILGVEDDILVSSHESSLANPETSRDYCSYTGIDAFAPAVGTAHGLYKGVPKVEHDLLKVIAQQNECPMVLHGGTGLSVETFQTCIRSGASKINISTAIKIAYFKGMTDYTQAHIGENNPLKLDAFVMGKVMECVTEHIEIFGSGGRANV